MTSAVIAALMLPMTTGNVTIFVDWMILLSPNLNKLELCFCLMFCLSESDNEFVNTSNHTLPQTVFVQPESSKALLKVSPKRPLFDSSKNVVFIWLSVSHNFGDLSGHLSAQ